MSAIENTIELGDATLDRDDPFENALIDIVMMNRRKRADYAIDGDPFSNFRLTAAMMGVENFDVTETILFNMAQKFARIKSLRVNGRMAQAKNETVTDTYLDLAVYGAILYAWVKQSMNSIQAGTITSAKIRAGVVNLNPE